MLGEGEDESGVTWVGCTLYAVCKLFVHYLALSSDFLSVEGTHSAYTLDQNSRRHWQWNVGSIPG